MNLVDCNLRLITGLLNDENVYEKSYGS